MALTNAIGLYDRGFGRWLDRFGSRNFNRLTEHFSEFLARRQARAARSNVWQIGEIDLLRAEIHPRDVVRMRQIRKAA